MPNPTLRSTGWSKVSMAVSLAMVQMGALAQLPTGPSLISGSATINQVDRNMSITSLPGTIINWNSFNIGTAHSVTFNQANTGSAILNRITGLLPSEIQGLLQSNGRVFLINPNGILFGNGAVVDVQGLVASTLNLSDRDFSEGRYQFTCDNATLCNFAAPDALNAVRNRIVLEDGATITTARVGPGGQVWLIARDQIIAEPGSSINAPFGQVFGATAREVSITSPSLGAIRFVLTGTTSTKIDLSGNISTQRGAAGFFADNIRFGGSLTAQSELSGIGQIIARADQQIIVDNDATLDVSGAEGADGGAIDLRSTRELRVENAGQLFANAGKAIAAGDTNQAMPEGRGGSIYLESEKIYVPVTSFSAYSGFPNFSAFSLRQPGSVLVNETGQYDYSLNPFKTFFSEGISTTVNSRAPNFGPSSFSQTSRNSNESFFLIPSGDGNFLVITFMSERDESFSFVESNKVEVFSPSGELITNIPISAQIGFGSPKSALTRGGWVIALSPDESRANTQLMFVSSTGEVLATPLFTGESLAESYNTKTGGLIAGFRSTQTSNADVTYREFDAQGRLLRDGISKPPPLLHNTFASMLFAFGSEPDVFYQVREGSTGGAFTTRIDARTSTTELAAEPYGVIPSCSSGWVSCPSGLTSVFVRNGVSFLEAATQRGPDSVQGQLKVFKPGSLEVSNIGSPFGLFSNQGDVDGAENFTVSSSTFFSFTDLGTGLGAGAHGSVGNVESVFKQTTTETIQPGNVANGTTQTLTQSLESTSALLLIGKSAIGPGAVKTGDTQGELSVGLGFASAPGQRNGFLTGTENPLGEDTPTPPTGTQGTSSLPGRPLNIARPEDTQLPPVGMPSTRTLEIPTGIGGAGLPGQAQSRLSPKDVEKFIESELGPEFVDRLRSPIPEEREKVLNLAVMKQQLPEEFFEALRERPAKTHQQFFSALALGQQIGALDDPELMRGFSIALTEKVKTESTEGGEGVLTPRTRFEISLNIFSAELENTTDPAEIARLRRQLLRDMVLVANEGLGKTVDFDAPLTVPDGQGGKAQIDDDGNVIR